MRNSWKTIWTLLLCATTALAEPDTLGLGTGRDGPLLVNEPGRIINHYAQVTAPLAPGDAVLFVESAGGFAAGDLVMVLQTTGIVPEPRRGEPGPIDLTRDPVGRWELARVEAARVGEVWLTSPLIHSYAASVTQVIRVPEYTSVEVRPGASVVARHWDGATGGVLAFLANGTIRNDGELQASGAGFRGGVAGQQPFDLVGCSILPREVRTGARRGEGISSLSYGPLETGLDNASNGGGGGLCPMSGGGGGGNGAAGGRGGDSVAPWDATRDLGGLGGAALSYSMLDHLTLGGGGGRGHGAWEGNAQAGAGGGAIFIRGLRLTGKGTIAADGEAGEQTEEGGGSGGGAGGSLYLRLASSAECGIISARGGAGGSAAHTPGIYTGPGGGGGGGRVLYQAAATESCPISVEAGPAGGEALSQGMPGAGAGTITRLMGGFSQEFVACTAQTPAFQKPQNFNAVNDTTPLFEVKFPSNPAATDNYVVRIYLDQDGTEQSSDPLLGTATRDGTNNLWTLDPPASAALQAGANGIRAFAELDCGPGLNSKKSVIISIFVDVTNPTTVIENKPPVPSNSASATFSYKVTNEAREVLFRCKLDSEPVEDCGVAANNVSVSKSYNNLSASEHTFTVYAIDAATNVGASVSHTWTIDLTPPVTEITSKPPVLSNQTQANFQFTGAETGGRYFCRLDNGPFEACDSGSKSYPVMDGPRTFCVYAVDAAGNVDATPECYTWTVDSTPPVTAITQKPPAASNQTQVTFLFDGAGLDGQYTCKLDTGNDEACNLGSKTYSGLTEQSHTFCVRATDKAGNVDGTPECHTWTVDVTPPVTVITRKPAHPSNETTATFEFQGAGTGGKFWCKLDAGAYEACDSGTKSYPALLEKEYTFCVYSVDAATNQEVNPVCHTWKVDVTAPEVTIDPTSKPRDPSNSSSVTFKYSASEPGSALFCKLDAGAYEPCGVNEKSYTNLAETQHTFCVYAQDAAGNKNENGAACHTWTVDRTPPVSVIGQKPPNPSNQTTALFTFSGGGNNGKYWCRLDSGAEAPCNSRSQEYDSLIEGTHTFCVRAQDAAGNDELVPVCYTWGVDLTEPDTVIGNRPANPTQSTDAAFTFTGAGNNGKYWCTLNGGTAESCDSGSKTYTGLTERTHTFCVKAVDAGGNADSSPACYAWVVDRTPPNTTIGAASKPLNPTNSRTAEFNFIGAGLQGEYECKLDQDPWEDCDSGSKMITQLQEGSHTFCVYAIDAAGNTDASPDCYTWQVDLTPPVTVIDPASKPQNPTSSTSATFLFTGAGPQGRYQCRLNKDSVVGPEEPCNFESKQYSALVDGTYEFCVYAIELAGNADATPDCHTWEVDRAPPDTVIDQASKPRDPTNSTTAIFTFTGTSPGGGYVCRLNSGPEEACNSGRKEYTGLVEQVHTFTVAAVDAAGNKDQTPATHTWKVDITRPDTVIDEDGKPDNPTNVTTASFTFSGAGPGGKFWCSLDEANAEACDSGSESYSGLADGEHTFCVYAVDAANNADESAACHTWTVDTAVPVTLLLDPKPPSPTASSNATFYFSGAETGGTYWCKLDSNAEEECRLGNHSYAALSEGQHTFCVSAQDAAGNRDASPECYTWVVDITPPDTSIDGGKPADPTNVRSATFTFSGTGGAARFKCRMDLQNYEDCSDGDFSVGNLAEGRHTFCVYAEDALGNADPTAACYSWDVDLTAPVAAIDLASKPANPSNTTTVTFTFTGAGTRGGYRCRLDSGIEELCDSGSKEYSGLSEQSHTFSVYAVDAAGNVGSPAEHTWTVDTTAPVTRITSAPVDPTQEMDATFTFTGAGVGGKYLCKLDNDPESNCDSGSVTYTGLAEGRHVFQVKAIDAAGNIEPVPQSHSWEIDRTAPPVLVATPRPNQKLNNASPEFTGIAPEDLVSIALYIDGAKVAADELLDVTGGDGWKLQAQNLADGPHSVFIEAKDRAGNMGKSVKLDFIVDTVDPETGFNAVPPQIHNSRLAFFEFTAPGETETNTTFVCTVQDEEGTKVDGKCSGKVLALNLAMLFERDNVNGDYTLEVSAKDEAGNLDKTPAAYSWNVIVDPPAPPEISAPFDGEVVYGLTPTISGTTVRKGTVELFFDSEKVGLVQADDKGMWTFRFPDPLEEGEYSLHAIATDTAGNPSASSSPIRFTVREDKLPGLAIGGGLGCAASGPQTGLSLLGLIAGAAWRSRRRRR